MCEAIEAKIKGNTKPGSKPACVTSTSDLVGMTHAMLNSPDYEVATYTKKTVDKDGKPTPIYKNPAKRYRDSMKPVLTHMGIDRAEVDKIDTIPFSKEHAGALIELATHVQKDYLNMGRRFVYPITNLDEAQMSLSITDVDEKVTKPNRFVKDDSGRSVPEPTGKTVTTAPHKAIKARNVIPFWLRTSKDSED